MPSFSGTFGGGIVTTLSDPERAPGTNGPNDKGAPSRLNPSTDQAALHCKVTPGTLVEVHAIVAGVQSPPDSALGGDLFQGTFAEWPGRFTVPGEAAPFVDQPLVAFSSWLRFVPITPGHYTFVLNRAWGTRGRLLMHLSVEADL